MTSRAGGAFARSEHFARALGELEPLVRLRRPALEGRPRCGVELEYRGRRSPERLGVKPGAQAAERASAKNEGAVVEQRPSNAGRTPAQVAEPAHPRPRCRCGCTKEFERRV